MFVYNNLEIIRNKILSQCDFTIENAEQHGTVSGKHATISETDSSGIFLFEDHSKNGSYINGQLLHNGSRKISVTDHITLGRTYTLPFEDIVNRYFIAQRTTHKKPQSQPTEIKINPMVSADPIMPVNDGTSPLPREDVNNEPSVVTIEKIVEKEKVPTWYWVLYAASIIVAFIVGVFMNF